MLRVYLDNTITSGRVTRRLFPKTELEATDELYRLHECGSIKIVTSKMSALEQQQTRDQSLRATFAEHQSEVSCVQADHQLLGFNTVHDQYGGFVTSPLISDIVDEGLYGNLIAAGLKDADAKHLMYAAHAENNCQFFVAVDKHFIDRRSTLEALCVRIRIVTPSEMLSVIGSCR